VQVGVRKATSFDQSAFSKFSAVAVAKEVKSAAVRKNMLMMTGGEQRKLRNSS
jgi:hypothetical protein